MRAKKKDPPLNRNEVKPAPRKLEAYNGGIGLQPRAIYDGMLDEVTVTPTTQAELAWEYHRNNMATGGIETADPLFDILTGGVGVGLRSAARGASRIASTKAGSILARNTNLSGIQKAYNRQMAVPIGANMTIADDIFKGNSLIGKGETFTKDAALSRVSNFQKDLSPVPFTYAHGSGADALPGIFKNKGLRGASELRKSNQLVTGEDLLYQKMAPHLYDEGVRATQSSVSTASIANPEVAAQYALEYGKETASNYPLVFGINPKAGGASRMYVPSGDIKGEAMFRGGIGLDEISNVFVPNSKKAQFMEQYGSQLGSMKVGSFEDYLDQASSLMTRGKIRGAKEYLSKPVSNYIKPKPLPGSFFYREGIEKAVKSFEYTDDIARRASQQPLGLPEPLKYYRATTPEKFSGIMNPISTTGKAGDRAENLRFFSPDKAVASNYLSKDGVGVTARMNINKPFIQQGNKLLTNEYVQNLIDQGYDAIQTLPFNGSKNLRDAFEVVPLNKNILSDIKQTKFKLGGKII